MNKPKLIQASLAFVFDQNFDKVLLIKKQRPKHHAGLLNGLGGKQEAGESKIDCVVREVKEEAGLTIAIHDWLSVGRMTWSFWEVDIWTCSINIETNTKLDFPELGVDWHRVENLPSNIVANLCWLIPLCIEVNQTAVENHSTLTTKIQYD